MSKDKETHYDKLPMWTKPEIEWRSVLIFVAIVIFVIVGVILVRLMI